MPPPRELEARLGWCELKDWEAIGVTVSPSFKAFVSELLSGLGPVMIRGMFGGAGVFANGVMFALIYQDTLYLKVNDRTTKDFEAEGARPFTYETNQGTHTLASYWQVPERLYDDPDEMTEWARQAFEAALVGAKPKKQQARAVRKAARPSPRPTRSKPRVRPR